MGAWYTAGRLATGERPCASVSSRRLRGVCSRFAAPITPIPTSRNAIGGALIPPCWFMAIADYVNKQLINTRSGLPSTNVLCVAYFLSQIPAVHIHEKAAGIHHLYMCVCTHISALPHGLSICSKLQGHRGLGTQHVAVMMMPHP